jgi:hypothetical protein
LGSVQRVGEDLEESVVTIGSDGWPALAGAVREVRESRVQDAIVEFLDGTARPPGRRSWTARRGSGRRKSGPWTGCWHPGGSSGRGRVGRGTPTGCGWHRGPIPFPCFRAEYIQRTAARKRKTGLNPRQYWGKAVRWSSARNRVQRTESSPHSGARQHGRGDLGRPRVEAPRRPVSGGMVTRFGATGRLAPLHAATPSAPGRARPRVPSGPPPGGWVPGQETRSRPGLTGFLRIQSVCLGTFTFVVAQSLSSLDAEAPA